MELAAAQMGATGSLVPSAKQDLQHLSHPCARLLPPVRHQLPLELRPAPGLQASLAAVAGAATEAAVAARVVLARASQGAKPSLWLRHLLPSPSGKAASMLASAASAVQAVVEKEEIPRMQPAHPMPPPFPARSRSQRARPLAAEGVVPPVVDRAVVDRAGRLPFPPAYPVVELRAAPVDQPCPLFWESPSCSPPAAVCQPLLHHQMGLPWGLMKAAVLSMESAVVAWRGLVAAALLSQSGAPLALVPSCLAEPSLLVALCAPEAGATRVGSSMARSPKHLSPFLEELLGEVPWAP